MPAILMLSHEVKDFASWKPGFDAHAPAREAAGIKVVYLTQDVNNPNLVHGVMEAASAEVFQAFLSNPALAEAMEKGGVIGRPDARVGNAV